jgi:tripartite-type tricarboxylate transporter receptor subunit TctC
VTVPADSGIESIDDLAQQARDSNVVTAGPPPGSLPHIAQAALAQELGVEFRYIPHEGINAVAQSMLGGRVHMTVWFADAEERFGLVPLAILDSQRSAELPDVPTLSELGYENIENYVWFGFFAPAGTPDDVVATLSDACDQAVHDDGFVANMEAANRQIRYMPTDEFSEFFARQFEANGELLSELGLTE